MRVGERVLELQDVPDVGASKAVDAVVRHDSVGNEVVRVLYVEVVERPVDCDPLHGLDDVIAAIRQEDVHARQHEPGWEERQRVGLAGASGSSLAAQCGWTGSTDPIAAISMTSSKLP